MAKDSIYEIYQEPMNGRENGSKVIKLRLSIFVYYLRTAKSIRGACNQHNVATKFTGNNRSSKLRTNECAFPRHKSEPCAMGLVVYRMALCKFHFSFI